MALIPLFSVLGKLLSSPLHTHQDFAVSAFQMALLQGTNQMIIFVFCFVRWFVVCFVASYRSLPDQTLYLTDVHCVDEGRRAFCAGGHCSRFIMLLAGCLHADVNARALACLVNLLAGEPGMLSRLQMFCKIHVVVLLIDSFVDCVFDGCCCCSAAYLTSRRRGIYPCRCELRWSQTCSGICFKRTTFGKGTCGSYSSALGGSWYGPFKPMI